MRRYVRLPVQIYFSLFSPVARLEGRSVEPLILALIFSVVGTGINGALPESLRLHVTSLTVPSLARAASCCFDVPCFRPLAPGPI